MEEQAKRLEEQLAVFEGKEDNPRNRHLIKEILVKELPFLLDEEIDSFVDSFLKAPVAVLDATLN